jgi:predicted ATPase
MPPLYDGSSSEAALRQTLLKSGAHPIDAPRAARVTNLPAPLTRFIGRERELVEVGQLIRAHRLVSLTGTGGVGKTRLALEAGQQLCGEFAGGVWLAELAPLIDPAVVPRALAEVFGLPEEIGRTHTAALVEYLATEKRLLILDTCEHLIAACAELVEALLAGCPHLHILATSREPIQAAGEITWRVPSLATPDIDPLHTEQLMEYDAVELFVSQAGAALPDFRLTPENLVAVAQICRRLDGIPLAIEMAGAQVSVMTPREIAARLDERFTLLVNPRRIALPRQRTLRATLDWSYHLLSEPERILLARLSVFADGCTADMAQVICGEAEGWPSAPMPAPSSLIPSDILPLLFGLVHKSLVVADTRGEQTRYRLLDTVRHYAAEKLAERGETAAMYGHLAAHLARPAPRDFASPKREWKEWFLTELGNIRNLIAWARGQPDGAACILQLAAAFADFSYQVGNLTEPKAWLEEGLSHGAAVPVAVRVEALGQYLSMLDFAGYNLGHWLAQAEELTALSEHVDNDIHKYWAFFYLAEAAADHGDLDRAEHTLEQGLAFARRRTFIHGIALSLCRLGLIRAVRGDYAGSAELNMQALQVGHESGEELFILLGLSGMTHADAQRSVPLIEKELARMKGSTGEWVDGVRAACYLQVYVQALLRTGQYAQAEARARESLELFSALHKPWFEGWGIGDSLMELGRIAWLRGDFGAARTYAEQSLELYRRVGDLEHVAQAHALMGLAALALGDTDAASHSLRLSLAAYRQLDHPVGIVMVQAALAESRGDTTMAARLYGAVATAQMPVTNWLTRMDSTFRHAFRVFHDRVMEDARRRYAGADPACAAAWAEGAAMTLEQASEHAERQSLDH